jgi:hypothetical protein
VLRRSSDRSTIECLKHGSTSRGSSVRGRPLSSSVLPRENRVVMAWLWAMSTAMKAGTSTIRLALGLASIRSCSRLSLTTLSETLPAPSGHTSATAASSAPASSAISGLAGNTVRRVAMTVRSRSIIGE